MTLRLGAAGRGHARRRPARREEPSEGVGLWPGAWRMADFCRLPPARPRVAGRSHGGARYADGVPALGGLRRRRPPGPRPRRRRRRREPEGLALVARPARPSTTTVPASPRETTIGLATELDSQAGGDVSTASKARSSDTISMTSPGRADANRSGCDGVRRSLSPDTRRGGAGTRCARALPTAVPPVTHDSPVGDGRRSVRRSQGLTPRWSMTGECWARLVFSTSRERSRAGRGRGRSGSGGGHARRTCLTAETGSGKGSDSSMTAGRSERRAREPASRRPGDGDAERLSGCLVRSTPRGKCCLASSCACRLGSSWSSRSPQCNA